MRRVAPLAFHARYELVGALTERRDPPSAVARFDRSHAPGERGTTPLGKPPGFHQIHAGKAAKPHFLVGSAEPEQEHPALGAALIDDKIKPTTVSMATRFFDRRNSACAQSVHLPRHSVHPYIYPTARHGL